MKKLSFIFLFLPFALLCSAENAIAQQQKTFVTAGDIDAEVSARVNPRDADVAISDKENGVDLMINDGFMVIQFTDQKLENIHSEIRGDLDNRDEPHMIEVFRAALGSGVRTMLDRAIAIPMYEIGSVSYSNGRLHIISNDGTDIFHDIKIEDKPLMEQFSRRDARRFIAEAEKWMI